jgi:hypothetical protein
MNYNMFRFNYFGLLSNYEGSRRLLKYWVLNKNLRSIIKNKIMTTFFAMDIKAQN